ncbi:hypothetical protein A2W14_04515 [Candidatus Gottesmanbacteria bacterium RBG_16_37_8]|uniref:Translation elongation factor-like protein n=1 Tax=Candidatus Gottesmanbacteria bacterium RBG_16_37_8 TaxID=1798371 RepID=A0A1F5YSM2_9BACT|nr:MAG: hypothetical protein A2W14_04515 [Candidatus Gottesmanbacteria bacterium RBG_16_37_8]
MDKKIGTVTHYYDKIAVAVIKLTAPLKVGNTVKFSGHDQEFVQEVKSMQLDHIAVDKGKKGAEIAIKVDQKVKQKDKVYLVS